MNEVHSRIMYDDDRRITVVMTFDKQEDAQAAYRRIKAADDQGKALDVSLENVSHLH